MVSPLLALVAVAGIAAVAFAGAGLPQFRVVFAVAVPAAAGVLFVAGTAWRVLRWAGSPVPFRIPLTAGQQGSFGWLRRNRFDNPSTPGSTVVRVALEVLLFRSLLRNVTAVRHGAGRVVFREALGLWLAAIAFHYSLLVIALRHLRFFLQPVPAPVSALASIDGFLQTGVPTFFATDVVFVLALTYLLARRVRDASLRYISLVVDYALPLLLLGVAATGLLMRHVVRVDTIAVKELALALMSLSTASTGRSLHPLVFVHVTLASALIALLPFSKLAHMMGVFLSPTRNLPNNSRAVRHLNPWNPPVDVHTYAQWEDEFRDKMIAAGVPLDEPQTVSAGGGGGGPRG